MHHGESSKSLKRREASHCKARSEGVLLNNTAPQSPALYGIVDWGMIGISCRRIIFTDTGRLLRCIKFVIGHKPDRVASIVKHYAHSVFWLEPMCHLLLLLGACSGLKVGISPNVHAVDGSALWSLRCKECDCTLHFDTCLLNSQAPFACIAHGIAHGPVHDQWPVLRILMSAWYGQSSRPAIGH